MLEAIFMFAATVPAAEIDLDPTIPGTIEFETSIEHNKELLALLCSEMEVRKFDPPQMPVARESHNQIDCRGFEFLGKPRLAEFVFADDQLKLVWILVNPDEREPVVAAMRAAYQSEGLVSELVIGFPKHRTAWRNEPAEVLFYAESVAPFFESVFGKRDD